MILYPHLKRNKFGFVRNQVGVLRFLYEQPKCQAEAIRIGNAVRPDAEHPSTAISGSLLALRRKKLIQRVAYGFYELTSSGKRLVEEMGDE